MRPRHLGWLFIGGQFGLAAFAAFFGIYHVALILTGLAFIMVAVQIEGQNR